MYKSYGVTFILQRGDGKILLQLRDDGKGKDIAYPNTWCIPGGMREKNEDYAKTVRREVEEEFGLILRAEDCHYLMEYVHNQGLDKIFLCSLPDNSQPVLKEGSAMGWFDFDEIEKMPLGFGVDKILKQIKEKIKGHVK